MTQNTNVIGDRVLEELLSRDIYDALLDSGALMDASEIRLRIGKPMRYMRHGVYHTLLYDGEVMVTQRCHIDEVLAAATGRSLYAYNEEMSRGFITYKGGVRIGLGGTNVIDVHGNESYKDISYLVIRIPTEIYGVATPLLERIKDFRSNVLIISPPGGGKTTLLRDYVRTISDGGVNVLLMDERGEIACAGKNGATLDVGTNTDVITGNIKSKAYETAIRAMSPEVVAMDELFGDKDVDVVRDIIRAGIRVIATLHGSNIESLAGSIYEDIVPLFDYVAMLSNSGGNYSIEVLNNE